MTSGIPPMARCASAAAVLAALTACGGGGSGAAGPGTYNVGGTVTGLTGSGLVLQSSGVNLPVSSSGAFTFRTPLVNGSPVLGRRQDAAVLASSTVQRLE